MKKKDCPHKRKRRLTKIIGGEWLRLTVCRECGATLKSSRRRWLKIVRGNPGGKPGKGER